MLYKVVIRKKVYSDIDELVEYIYRFSFSKQISNKIYDELYKKIFSLNFMPEMYQEYLGEYRRIIVKWSYKIIYKIEEENKKVIIIRVIRTERTNFNLS